MVIHFIRSAATGKLIPAQLVRTVYEARLELSGETELQTLPSRDEHFDFYVSHFETCPQASSFSARARKGGGT